MELRITHFSQDISLVDPSQGKFFIVVETDDGRTVRIPVQQETTDALIKLALVPEKPKPVEVFNERKIAEVQEEEDEHPTSTPDDEDLDKPLWIPPTEEDAPSPETYVTDDFDENGNPNLDEDGIASV